MGDTPDSEKTTTGYSPESGVYAKIPISKLTLEEAYVTVHDPSYWDETMPPVLYHYRMLPSEYHKLTVYQHRLLVDFLEAQGLL